MKIYHNPRCRKSREGIKYLESKKINFEVIDYIKNNLSTEQIKNILKKLYLKPIELVRKNEVIWKEKYKGKDFTDDQLIKILSNEPKLIERPIIVSEKLAVIGRPAENIDKLL
ncbi:MAG: arsenate reductase (glutaredoxin) [Flavobacteriaceae bacterium]|nr:arsenate reductase (glutaredoxin) [Flavobacteriaceae bacterium]|tara:strand:+ start:34297 stop:34635 length:339 start_codon:yes stop_codon:yes gene_type:complete